MFRLHVEERQQFADEFLLDEEPLGGVVVDDVPDLRRLPRLAPNRDRVAVVDANDIGGDEEDGVGSGLGSIKNGGTFFIKSLPLLKDK